MTLLNLNCLAEYTSSHGCVCDPSGTTKHSMSFEVWLCLIFVVIIKLWTFFFLEVYDNLLFYHTDAFGKMISFILSLLF